MSKERWPCFEYLCMYSTRRLCRLTPAQTFGHMFAADLQLESRIQSTNWKYPGRWPRVSVKDISTQGWSTFHGRWWHLRTQSSSVGLPLWLQGSVFLFYEMTFAIRETLLLLFGSLFQMTKNSPKFVEVVGAILITVGFLILGKPRKHRYNIFCNKMQAILC